MPEKHVIILGAGPGGLTCAMILASRGVKVTVIEKDKIIGGRNKQLRLADYTFDTGPTFLNMPFVLKEMFQEAGEDINDHLDLDMLDPLYRLDFGEKVIYPTTNHQKMAEEISKNFPGNEAGLEKFFSREKERFESLFPCLQKEYSSIKAFLSPIFLKALPHIGIGQNLFENLGNYFNDDDLKTCFTFQSKYLGMSPWHCPALFTILSYMEHAYGVAHVKGGLNKISEAMAEIAVSNGATIRTNAEVTRILTGRQSVKGIELFGGEQIFCDDLVINADFYYAATSLFDPGVIKKYTEANLNKKQFSCATFMLYLGVNKQYDISHHNIFFAQDYKKNVDDIFFNKKLSDDLSFYIQNACVTDPDLAPKGKSSIYVLVPVPNQRSGINWAEKKLAFKEQMLSLIEQRTPLKDLRQHIEAEAIISPLEWQNQYNVYIAAEFSLAHQINQMLYWRPHNKFEEVDHCFLVGGGTHPGSGLPTIYESGRISANLISKQYGIDYTPPSNLMMK